MEQIAGAIMLSAAILAGATIAGMGIRHLTVMKKERLISEREERKLRVAVNERLVKDGLHKMYAEENERRIAAETKLGIKEAQVKRLEKEVKRLKGLVEEAERRAEK